jgi:hypothetical protein
VKRLPPAHSGKLVACSCSTNSGQGVILHQLLQDVSLTAPPVCLLYVIAVRASCRSMRMAYCGGVNINRNGVAVSGWRFTTTVSKNRLPASYVEGNSGSLLQALWAYLTSKRNSRFPGAFHPLRAFQIVACPRYTVVLSSPVWPGGRESKNGQSRACPSDHQHARRSRMEIASRLSAAVRPDPSSPSTSSAKHAVSGAAWMSS